jgi:hypothetical protein
MVPAKALPAPTPVPQKADQDLRDELDYEVLVTVAELSSCSFTELDFAAIKAMYLQSNSRFENSDLLEGVSIINVACEEMIGDGSAVDRFEARWRLSVVLPIYSYPDYDEDPYTVFKVLKESADIGVSSGQFTSLLQTVTGQVGSDISEVAVVTDISYIYTFPEGDGAVDQPFVLTLSLLIANSSESRLSWNNSEILSSVIATGLGLKRSSVVVLNSFSTNLVKRRSLLGSHSLHIDLYVLVDPGEVNVDAEADAPTLEAFYFHKLHVFVASGNATTLFRGRLVAAGDGADSGINILAIIAKSAAPSAAPSVLAGSTTSTANAAGAETIGVLSVQNFTVIVSLVAFFLTVLLVLGLYLIVVRIVNKKEDQNQEWTGGANERGLRRYRKTSYFDLFNVFPRSKITNITKNGSQEMAIEMNALTDDSLDIILDRAVIVRDNSEHGTRAVHGETASTGAGSKASSVASVHSQAPSVAPSLSGRSSASSHLTKSTMFGAFPSLTGKFPEFPTFLRTNSPVRRGGDSPEVKITPKRMKEMKMQRPIDEEQSDVDQIFVDSVARRSLGSSKSSFNTLNFNIGGPSVPDGEEQTEFMFSET